MSCPHNLQVSPYFYLYLKLMLLRHVYAAPSDGGHGGAAPAHLLGLSLYTPRLNELRMPRRPFDPYAMLGPGNPTGVLSSGMGSLSGGLGGGRGGLGGIAGHVSYAGLGHTYLQQLPCSWGQLFFPSPWTAFREYMRIRLHGGAPAVNIRESACCQGTRWGNGGWGTSWKKFLIELSFLKGWVTLYPNFANQSSLSTNHLEPGEHIAGKVNALRHRPIDFTVPLVQELETLRTLWTTPQPAAAAGGASPGGAQQQVDRGRRRLAPLAPLHALPTLDLFAQRSSLETLAAKGAAAMPRGLEV